MKIKLIILCVSLFFNSGFILANNISDLTGNMNVQQNGFGSNLIGGFQGSINNLAPSGNLGQLILINQEGRVFSGGGELGKISPESIINGNSLNQMSQELLDENQFQKERNNLTVEKEENTDKIQDLRIKKNKKKMGNISIQ